MGWLSYVIAFAIVLGAAALLGWALLRQARGRGGCGSGCCTCTYFQDEQSDGCPVKQAKDSAGSKE